jgi:hypothetical protein
MELSKDWFDPNSIDKTLSNLIKVCDKDWVASVDRQQFLDGLTREILFIGVYPKEREEEVVEYIKWHVQGYHDEALRLHGLDSYTLDVKKKAREISELTEEWMAMHWPEDFAEVAHSPDPHDSTKCPLCVLPDKVEKWIIEAFKEKE